MDKLKEIVQSAPKTKEGNAILRQTLTTKLSFLVTQQASIINNSNSNSDTIMAANQAKFPEIISHIIYLAQERLEVFS